MASTTLRAEFSIAERYKTDRSSPVRWIVSHAMRQWIPGLAMLLGAFGNAALASLVPVYIGLAFNAILASPPQTDLLLNFALLIAGSQIVRALLQLGRNFGAELIAQRIERNIRDELYTSLLGKSMTFHSLQSVGDTMARATNDVREINFMFSPGINLVIGSANFMIMPILLAPRYHPALILTPILFIIAYFGALWLYLRQLRPITTEAREAFGQLNSRLAESLDGIETVKGMAQEKNEVHLFEKNASRFRDAFVKQGNVEARFIPLLLLGIAEAGGLLHALYLFNLGLINVGDVVAYFTLLQLFGFPTFVSLFSYSQVSLGMASARRVLEMLNMETDLDQNVSGYSGKMTGDVEFQDVSFEYEQEGPVLENISFTVKAGQTVAVVGQTGSGKTSLAKLLNRTYDVTAGKVFVDGLDVRDWNLEILRRNISIIEQDIFLFSRSISENIAFGKQDATQEEIDRKSVV